MEEEQKDALPNINKITLPKEKAKEEWKKYCEVLKKRKEKFLKIMKDAHYQLKEGRELIDIYDVMKKAGLNDKGEPKLAISRADLTTVYFQKRDEGSGRFGETDDYNSLSYNKDLIELPQKTFNIHWERKGQAEWSINKRLIKTKVPIIPVELLPEGELKNYYILWESKEWEEVPETKDPIILKRISENLFVILGSWDLTPLEQSIMRGTKE